jgi:hypothetical protein
MEEIYVFLYSGKEIRVQASDATQAMELLRERTSAKASMEAWFLGTEAI